MTDATLQELVNGTAERLTASGLTVVFIPNVHNWPVNLKLYAARHPDELGAFIHCKYKSIIRTGGLK